MNKVLRRKLFASLRQKYLFLLSIVLGFGLSLGALSSFGADSDTSLQVSIAKAHPLPGTLSRWQGTADGYFDQMRPASVGALIWSEWPIRVYVEPAPAAVIKPNAWQKAVTQAIQDWQPYLPLEIVKTSSDADIQISANPPRQKSGARVRSAETRYELFVSNQQTLRHRMSIYIRASQASQYLTAAARHEIGHALGIWGHSPNPNDVMYFAQVKTPPAISLRDIHTLIQVYQQPTQLGWPVKKL